MKNMLFRLILITTLFFLLNKFSTNLNVITYICIEDNYIGVLKKLNII